MVDLANMTHEERLALLREKELEVAVYIIEDLKAEIIDLRARIKRLEGVADDSGATREARKKKGGLYPEGGAGSKG